MAQAMSTRALAPSEAVALVLETLTARATLSSQTIAKFVVLMWQFAAYVERGHGIRCLTAVTPQVVAGYVEAPTSDHALPGVSLQQFRRLAVRLLFRTCRELGYEVGDPTLDLSLPRRAAADFRPLDDDEVELCRAATAGARRRVAAAWALCEASARTGELPALVRADVDLCAGRVWLHGSPRVLPRWAPLTDWGVIRPVSE